MKPIQIKITFMDESELIFTSNTTERKAAVADFLARQWVEINGVFYNKNLIFSWEVIDAKKA